MLRRYAETRYAAKTWGATERRVVARIEASSLGLDVRFVVTSLAQGSAERIYDTLYCARGQAENLIKLHKTQAQTIAPPAARPTPTRCGSYCTPPPTGCYGRYDAPSASRPLANAEFATVRLRLLKLAARVIETASRIRIAFAAACPDHALFRRIAICLQPAGP